MPKKILVVDDDRVILKFVTKLLQREGHEVSTAEDGFAALNLLTSYTPDIMFFDLIMPKIAGDKLIQIVRNMPHLQNCYLVIVSAAVAEIDFNFHETGADSYIAKGPFNSMAKHFLEAIKAADAPRDKDTIKAIRGLDGVYARQLTKELLSRNRHLETILESMAEGILEVFTGKIVYANAAAISLFGLPQEKLLGLYPPDLFDEKVRPQIKALFDKGFAQPAMIGENTPLELNGRQITISALPVKAEASTVIIMMTDITERRRLEMQLQHVQKMEAIGTIASGVAHNFRNTLTEILVNTQVLQMNHKDDPGLEEITGRIATSVRRGARLVDGLLQFSRKQIKNEFKPVDLVQVIREIGGLIEKSFDKKIAIRLNLPDTLPVMGDHAALNQALMNLCTNARDAMPEGGRLQIEARVEGRRAAIVVSDTGQGMDAETREKCFDPFFTTKAVGKGTGLGLSTTYGIIKSHEGQIQVRSRLNQGTTFRLFFPLARQAATPAEEAAPEIVPGDGQRILVVDDEAEICKAMQELLTGLGYTSAAAESGAQALEKYRSWRPDVVLLDENMPGMSGLACAEKILAEDPAATIAVISGYEPEQAKLAQHLANDTIKGFLVKPVGIDELSALLAELLKGKRLKDKG